jgi:hypothetical protein
MARGKSYDVFKRDTLLFNWLREHKGEQNRVTSHEIQKFLEKNGYSIKRNNVGTLINKIMYERNAPIVYANTKGYYWATTREELEKTIADLESRRNSLQEHINHLKGFMI